MIAESELVPSLKNLAAYQQVPLPVLARMLDALQRDGLVTQSADNPSQLLAGSAALQRIRLVGHHCAVRVMPRTKAKATACAAMPRCRDCYSHWNNRSMTELGEQTLAGVFCKP